MTHMYGVQEVAAMAPLLFWNGLPGQLGALGVVHGPTTEYAITGAGYMRADCSWIAAARIPQIWPNRRVNIAPDFVVEVRSMYSSFDDLEEKMKAWILMGAQLALLMDPYNRLYEFFSAAPIGGAPPMIPGSIPVAGAPGIYRSTNLFPPLTAPPTGYGPNFIIAPPPTSNLALAGFQGFNLNLFPV